MTIPKKILNEINSWDDYTLAMRIRTLQTRIMMLEHEETRRRIHSLGENRFLAQALYIFRKELRILNGIYRERERMSRVS